jgi:hypothetical protein
MYYKHVDKRCRKALVDFLKKHFRYHYVEFRIMPSVAKPILLER